MQTLLFTFVLGVFISCPDLAQGGQDVAKAPTSSIKVQSGQSVTFLGASITEFGWNSDSG